MTYTKKEVGYGRSKWLNQSILTPEESEGCLRLVYEWLSQCAKKSKVSIKDKFYNKLKKVEKIISTGKYKGTGLKSYSVQTEVYEYLVQNLPEMRAYMNRMDANFNNFMDECWVGESGGISWKDVI